jgi:hypothetical protein
MSRTPGLIVPSAYSSEEEFLKDLHRRSKAAGFTMLNISDTDENVVEHFLEHHGVKGMKWGVRRDRGHEGQRAKTSKIARLDRKFEKRASTFGTELTLYSHAARRMNEFEIDRINRKPEYRNANLNKDTPTSRKYEKEMSDAFMKHLKEAAAEVGTNASGTKKYDIRVRPDGAWEVSVVDVKHADGSFVVNVTRDETGHITSLSIDDNSLMVFSPRDIVDVMGQSDEAVSDFLIHFGVKGMHWGIRRKRSSEHDSEDAKAASEAAKKVKKHGTSSLTNKELQQLVNRMNLEQQFNRLTPDSKGKAAAKFAKDLLVDVGKEQAKNLARQETAKLVAKVLATSVK